MLVTISRPPPIVCTCRMTNITDTFAAFQITTTFSVFGTFTVTLVAGLVARGGVIQGKAGGALGLLGCIVWGRGCWLGVCLLERKGNTYTVFGTWQGLAKVMLAVMVRRRKRGRKFIIPPAGSWD